MEGKRQPLYTVLGSKWTIPSITRLGENDRFHTYEAIKLLLQRRSVASSRELPETLRHSAPLRSSWEKAVVNMDLPVITYPMVSHNLLQQTRG